MAKQTVNVPTRRDKLLEQSSIKRGNKRPFLGNSSKSNARAIAAGKGTPLELAMKTNKPAAIAIALCLLFVASNVFAVLKPLYPLKAYPPDQTIGVGAGDEELGDSTVNKRE